MEVHHLLNLCLPFHPTKLFCLRYALAQDHTSSRYKTKIQVKLIQLSKRSHQGEPKKNQIFSDGKPDHSTKKRNQILDLKAKSRELESKLQISQDTVDKMMGRRLEGSTIEELQSLEEILLESYKLVISQKVRMQHHEEEKKKQVAFPTHRFE